MTDTNYVDLTRQMIDRFSGQLERVATAQESAHDERTRMHEENRNALNSFSEQVRDLSDRIIRIESSTMTIADHENRIRDLEKQSGVTSSALAQHVGASSSSRETFKWIVATVLSSIAAIAAGGWLRSH